MMDVKIDDYNDSYTDPMDEEEEKKKKERKNDDTVKEEKEDDFLNCSTFTLFFIVVSELVLQLIQAINHGITLHSSTVLLTDLLLLILLLYRWRHRVFASCLIFENGVTTSRENEGKDACMFRAWMSILALGICIHYLARSYAYFQISSMAQTLLSSSQTTITIPMDIHATFMLSTILHLAALLIVVVATYIGERCIPLRQRHPHLNPIGCGSHHHHHQSLITPLISTTSP